MSPSSNASATRAYNDPFYDTVVIDHQSLPRRRSPSHTSGPARPVAAPTEPTPSPTPTRFTGRRTAIPGSLFTTASSTKTRMTTLLGDYLIANPPNGSAIPACDPSNPSLVVDTELYFLFVLKTIEENGWNAVGGICQGDKSDGRCRRDRRHQFHHERRRDGLGLPQGPTPPTHCTTSDDAAKRLHGSSVRVPDLNPGQLDHDEQLSADRPAFWDSPRGHQRCQNLLPGRHQRRQAGRTPRTWQHWPGTSAAAGTGISISTATWTVPIWPR